MVAVTVQIHSWRQQHTSRHVAALGEAKGFFLPLPLFGVPGPRRALASGGKVSPEDRELIQELDGNFLYHCVKSPTSNETTKKPHDPKPKETNRQKPIIFIFASELWLAGTRCVSCGNCSRIHNGGAGWGKASLKQNATPWFGLKTWKKRRAKVRVTWHLRTG